MIQSLKHGMPLFLALGKCNRQLSKYHTYHVFHDILLLKGNILDEDPMTQGPLSIYMIERRILDIGQSSVGFANFSL